MRMVLLALICFSLIFATASAQDIVVPGDADGDMVVSDEELELAEQSFGEGKITSEQLEEIRHIHDDYPITITDSADREVTIYTPIQKIIIQHTTAYEPLFVLGAQDNLAGITTTAQECYSWVPGMEDKPTIGGYQELDYEKIIELKPDVVLTSKERPDMEEILEPANIPIIALKFAELDKFDYEFDILAELLGKEERAEEYKSWRNSHLTQIKYATEGIEQKVRVFTSGADTYKTWGSNTNGSGIHDIITSAGGYNIVSELPGSYYITVDPEWILNKDPEVVVATGWSSELVGYFMKSSENANQVVEELLNNEVIKETSAGKSGRVYLIDGSILLGSCSAPVGVSYCAKWFYPEQFDEMDPQELHREYIEEWLGAPYQGVWAYPLASA